MMKLRSLLLACAVGATAFGAALPVTAQEPGGTVIYVQTAPPAPVYETVPASPGSTYYWVSGYWSWDGSRYVWVHGHYVAVPYAGAVWHPGHWADGPNGWYWVPGHWASP